MGPSQNYLYCNTPANEFSKFYPKADRPFTHKITTNLPKHTVAIRAVAACALSALVVVTTPVWVWPVAVAGVAFAGWTIYSNLIKKDPLVEAFYKIVGGKDKYEKLPELKEIKNASKGFWDLDVNKITPENLYELDWDKLKHSLHKATTVDGRRILIVKALTRNPEQFGNSYSQVKTILFFIEKINNRDFSSEMYPVPYTRQRTDFHRSGVSPELANELLAQL